MVKFSFVTGGGVSGLGKGITASLGVPLRARDLTVTAMQIDLHVNVWMPAP